MTQDRIIGIVGGGQLARMMYQAGIALGLPLRLLAEGPATSAALVVAGAEVGDYRDPAAVTAFARGCDVVTFDHEHVPAALLRELEASGVRVRPGAAALAHAADKAVMRTRLTELGVPCPVWRIARTPGDLVAFGDEIGWPVIAKTSRGGYDGKGVWKVADAAGAHEPFAGLAEGVVVVAEEFVPFVRELSALVVRRPGGETVAYPVSESVQRDGICHETTTPAPGLSPARAAQITRLAVGIADALGVVGVLAVELMERSDGEVIVNELAMRPHNTGHWSIDGAVTSQFENHLRAVADLPLGDTSLRSPVVVMANVLGGSCVDLVGALPELFDAVPAAKVHLYGKDVVPGRKVGHVTVCGEDVAAVQQAARAASDLLEGTP